MHLNIAGGLEWGSGVLERAGNAYSDFLYGKNHNARWYSHGSAFVSSAIRDLQIGMAIVNPVFSFLPDTAFMMGVT